MPAKNIPSHRLIRLTPLGIPVRIKYKDIFDMKAFYEALREWLRDHGWHDMETKGEKYEKYYSEKVDQKGAKEIYIKWRLFKPAPGAKINYYLDFDFKILALITTEIVKEGKKFKVNKGEVELKMRMMMELAFLGEFEAHGLLNQFKDLFRKRIYKKTIDQRKKELYQEFYLMQNFMKQWFKLKRYLPYEETQNFWQSQAWPSHLREK